ncbi:MAG: GNAT family N-acetyltransferase [Candidatus Gracilibacteria bacterium]
MEGYVEQPEEFNAAEAIKNCLENPEAIDDLTPGECMQILEIIQARILEIFDPEIKAKYKVFAQRILQRYVMASGNAQQKPKINIEKSYEIDTAHGTATLNVNVCQSNNLSQAILMDSDMSQVVRNGSTGYLCTITDKERRFWINIKIFILKQKDGTELRSLFIADWYVSPNLRDSGIGKKLQDLAEQIGRNNACTSIFCIIIPENPNDLNRLIAANIRMGYQIKNDRGRTVGCKQLAF